MKSIKVVFLFILILLITSYVASAGTVTFKVSTMGLRMNTEIESYTEIQFRGVVKQKLDISCGSAALATIFQYYYGDPVEEEAIIESMVNGRTKEEIIAGEGFSLLELKTAAEKWGYSAFGLSGSLAALAQLSIPSIVLLETGDIPHFVVVRKVLKDSILVADPAMGNITISKSDFIKQWNGILLAIEGKQQPVSNYQKYMPLTAPTRLEVSRFNRNNWRVIPFIPSEF